MPKQITFTMGQADPKKHSTKFSTLTVEAGLEGPAADRFRPVFYVPAPFLDAKKLRVTIEEVE